MVIGLVLCGLVAVLLFFGVAERVFKSFGVAGWLAFVFIGVLIGCAFIPSFGIGAVRFNVAGFFAPLLFAAVFFFFAARTHEAMHALVTATVIVALFIAVWLLIDPVTSDVVTVIIAGFLCGAVGYLVGKTNLSALAAVFLGMPIGEVISSAVGVYAYGSTMQFGTAATFDAVILAAVFSVALNEAVSAIKRAMNNKSHNKTDMLLNTEAAEEFDKDEYKKYFDE